MDEKTGWQWGEWDKLPGLDEIQFESLAAFICSFFSILLDEEYQYLLTPEKRFCCDYEQSLGWAIILYPSSVYSPEPLKNVIAPLLTRYKYALIRCEKAESEERKRVSLEERELEEQEREEIKEKYPEIYKQYIEPYECTEQENAKRDDAR